FTGDLNRRVYFHNTNLSGYTRFRGPWDLIWYCVFDNENKAKEFERYLKTHSGRIFIKKRILSGEA
ncbi:MAG: GIY-YIG nuclease family protein, partial [Candidatus Omnitrophota bacterium]